MAIATEVADSLILAAEVWAIGFSLLVATVCFLVCGTRLHLWVQRRRRPAIQVEIQQLDDVWAGVDRARDRHPVTASVSANRRAA
jgi:hypothetical protein